MHTADKGILNTTFNVITTPNGKNLTEATLVKRINRFVAKVILNNRELEVYVPNTGRLSELALPGAKLLLSPLNSRYRYKILYILKDSFPIMIDSAYSNTLFHELIKDNKVPGFEQYRLIKREPVYGNHRFDFLMSDGKNNCYIELKSCTLFHKDTASFPDAVSSRASEHIKALAGTGNGKLVFLVLHKNMNRFIPNYHTDFVFYETLKSNMNKIDIHAYTVNYDKNLEITELKSIPVYIPDIRPEGIFILILHRTKDSYFSGIRIRQGYYICCISDRVNVFKTIAQFKRKKGPFLIFPEEIRAGLKIISDIPVVSDVITIDDVKEKLIVSGCSDVTSMMIQTPGSACNAVYFHDNPMEQSWFWDMILDMRFGVYSE